MKILSVIIVTYNSQSIIEKCLKNLFFQNDIGNQLEVIIVDNSPYENSKAMFSFIQNTFDEEIILIKNDRNGGYGQGNNLGIGLAKGKIIAIMNPDITNTESLFTNVLQKFENNLNLGMLGYKQFGGVNLSYYIRQEYNVPLITGMALKFFNKTNLFYSNFMYLSGAYLFINKKMFQKAGLFDENIFLYCEESDITKRILNAGFEIEFEKSKSYIHEIDGREEMSESGFKILLESSMYYLSKFNFSKNKFLNNMKIDLKCKKFIFQLRNNQKMVKILKLHINQILAFENSVSDKNKLS